MQVFTREIEADKITWPSTDKLTVKDLESVIGGYDGSQHKKLISTYKKYYEVKNSALVSRVTDRAQRNKTPNNFVPSAYYSTVIDTMAGYMFNNVSYSAKEESDQAYIDELSVILENNNVEVKDMQTGVRSLAFNMGVELVYTVGDGTGPAEIRFVSLDPSECIVIYDSTIEPDVFCFIRKYGSENEDYDYNVDVIYADEWQSYHMKNGELSQKDEPRKLLFLENPACVYNAQLLNKYSPFHQILTYIDALDYIISGNANEVERLVDAILVLGKHVGKEDLEHMDEWKVLQGMQKEDRAEYITKDSTPQFREYVSKLLINEIHKHSHVIDWYSPDSGLGGEVSAKALKTRLFDMDMYSNRIEKIYREGVQKRIRLINHLMAIKGLPVGNVQIEFNRTLPSDVEDKAVPLAGVDFISKQTKVELCGLDWTVEQERLNQEREESMEFMDEAMPQLTNVGDKTDENVQDSDGDNV